MISSETSVRRPVLIRLDYFSRHYFPFILPYSIFFCDFPFYFLVAFSLRFFFMLKRKKQVSYIVFS
jgi:hypothetical protein